MEEYLRVDELSSRIKFSRQSIYNLIYKKTFIMGKHYFKPTPKKILFKWSEVRAWIEGSSNTKNETPVDEPAKKNPYEHTQSAQNTPKKSINI